MICANGCRLPQIVTFGAVQIPYILSLLLFIITTFYFVSFGFFIKNEALSANSVINVLVFKIS